MALLPEGRLLLGLLVLLDGGLVQTVDMGGPLGCPIGHAHLGIVSPTLLISEVLVVRVSIPLPLLRVEVYHLLLDDHDAVGGQGLLRWVGALLVAEVGLDCGLVVEGLLVGGGGEVGVTLILFNIELPLMLG